ncbi:TonB-dependent receptor plug domain-containing protein [Spirosoma sp. HMF4905]|uniref:TonB-dependent receptor plug domain-containing protein n=1 Tax=Spirosoma arboris TaxID=2682092 RepID=A0A7K1S687_9BACT|nr:TonB-dependent receptor [Spirosoma arboris]MVM29240.1 TonB-dependent receptor plug domain-containing protein [Spirosoma arboris]
MLSKRYFWLVASICLFFTTSLFAQTPGIIKGQLTDLLTKEALIGAGVLVKGTTLGGSTDIEGNFIINKVPAGKYTLVISSVGYQTAEIPNITVEPDKITLVNTTLATDQKSLQEVVVRASRNTNTEIAVISQIREAQQVVSGISAEQIVKSQDRDAAEVVRRIPGVTIVDNRFINIRGLNDRYNTVWLNDAVAPSSETDRKAFSFDIIPSNLLDRVLIFKTPSPELPGDFAGGMVKVYTRQPSYTERSLNVSYTVGARAGTTFNNFTSDVKYNKDWLGFGDSDRKLPVAIPNSNGVIPTAQAKTFPNTYPLTTNSAIPDQRFNISYLTGIKLGNQSLGSLSALSYSNTFTSFDINRLDVFREDVFNKDKQYSNNVRFGLLQNFIYSFGNGSKIEFRNMFNQLSRNQVTTRDSYDEQGVNLTKYSYSEGYQSRQVYNGQLAGNHTVDYKGGLQIDWVLGYARSNKHEPDYRRLQYNAQSNQAILPQSGVDLFTGSRLYQDLGENIYSLNLGLKQKFSDHVEVSLGTYIENKDRTFVARQFGYSLSAINPNYTQLLSQPINQIFNPQNVETGTGFGFEEDGNSIATQPGVKPNYSYDASNKLAAGYTSLNYTSDKIKLLVGARFEHNVQSIVAGLNGTPINRSVTTDKLLPSANFSYNITEKALIRAAYGRTLNRPEFREWAPFVYYDFDLNALTYGSLYLPSAGNGTVGTLLKVADIDNFDLRYEYYPSNGENVHFGVFYKHFNNPIESSIANNPSNLAFTYINAPSAYAMGVELDVRKRLDFLSGSFFKNLTLLFNGSLIKSEVKVDAQQSWTPNRKLQGQSPYVVNMGLYYQTTKWQFSGLYNVFGPRIVYVGSSNPPYSEVVEMPRNTIDLTVSRDITNRFSINGGISDLLNQRVLMLQDDPTNKNSKFERSTDPHFIDYKRGSYFTLGLRYRFF